MNVEINPSEYKVLIVDDVISNVLLLKVLLTNEKFNIVTAGNGTQALEQVKKEKPDLVLLDVMMPDISGFEVAQQMKADEEMSEIPVIFLTALNSTADIVKGFQVGGNDFISKPFNKEELIIRVTHQISLVAAKRIIIAQTEELRKTIIGRDKLYSVIAHDLRSPMGSIKMVLNMLILNLPSETIGSEMYELLTMANQTTEDVFSLLDNLLKWTKSQIGKLKVVYQNIDMVEVVEGVSEIFTMVAGLKNIHIAVEIPEDRMEVRADIDMIKTVIRNLISNAIKFSNEGSEVLVSLREEDSMAIVSVKDSGCGIDEENLHTSLSEYYIDRITTGLPATVNYQGKKYPLKITKVVPEVKDRMFDVDLVFTGDMPDNVRVGKSFRVQIELGQPERALIIPRGNFYQSTGGQWIYKVNASKTKAIRVPLSIGRQNPQQYEITEGLQTGDWVITTGYDTFGDAEELILK